MSSVTQKELTQRYPEPYSDSDDDEDYHTTDTLHYHHTSHTTQTTQKLLEPNQQQIIDTFLSNIQISKEEHTECVLDIDNIKNFRQFVIDNKNNPKMHQNNLNRKHYKVEKYLPIPIFKGELIKTGFIYYDKLKCLKDSDILELYKIGNPLISEKKGGLTLHNIYKNIHNNKLGTMKDYGRNLSNGLIRIWSIFNQ